MKLLFANPKYWPALWQDTIGQEDKAKATLGIATLEDKKNFWYTTAVLCAAVGVLGAVPSYGVSLLLLGVTWRKWDLIRTKKEAPPLGLTGMDIALHPIEGTYTWTAAIKWRLRQVASHVRTSWKSLLVGALAVAALVGVGLTAISRHTTAPATICECPLKKEPVIQGESGKTKEVTKQKSEKGKK